MLAEIMIAELIYYLFVFIACIAVMIRFRVFHRFLPKSLVQKIRAELSSFKVSTPNLKSTSDSTDSTSR